MRIGLGAVVGFVLWSVLWLGANAALRAAGVLPAPETPVHAAAPMLALLVVSIACSIVAGYAAVRVARLPVAAVVLGVALLVVGVAVQVKYWSLMPSWYSIAFILLLLPMAVVGGRLAARTSTAGPAPVGA